MKLKAGKPQYLSLRDSWTYETGVAGRTAPTELHPELLQTTVHFRLRTARAEEVSGWVSGRGAT